MLLHDSQMFVLLCPPIFRSAFGLVRCGSYIRACKTRVSVGVAAVEAVIVCCASSQLALEVRRVLAASGAVDIGMLSGGGTLGRARDVLKGSVHAGTFLQDEID